MTKFNDKTYKQQVTSNYKGIKVSVLIPDTVRNKPEKINRIYNILKPVKVAN